jgi:RHS repeat-associated protein
MANGTLASNTYDNANQLLILANLTTSGTTLSSFNYTYNPVGSRTQVVEANGDVLTLAYDPTYQLTNEKRSGANSYNISYTYDPVGNRTVLTNSGALTTNTYNAGNELVTSQASAGVTTSTYDGDGNLLTSLAPGSQSTTNTWDGENRLTRTALPSGIVDSFTYNGDGLRVQKIDSTGTTNHVWDGQNILLDANASNVIQAVYTLKPRLYGDLVSQWRTGTASFYLMNGAGSTVQLVSVTGSVTDSYLYDSFGNALSLTGTTVNPFRYIGLLGYYYDSDLGNHYVRARYYSPTRGAFLSIDPLAAAPNGMTAYAYALNSPTMFDDPSGLSVQCRCTSTCVEGTTSTCTITATSADCNVTAPGYSCQASVIPGPGPYYPMSGNSAACPQLAAAIAIANSVVNGGGACQQWFNKHGGPKCGPFPVTVLYNYNPLCVTPIPSANFGGLGAIFICEWACAPGTNLTYLVGLLIHEYAHSYCIPLPYFGENCATDAQNACGDEISTATLHHEHPQAFTD